MQNSYNTPLMKQYYEIKSRYPGIILFFRLGDFYEMFDEQAREVSAILSLTLTQRHGIPMCGIPFHAAATYIGRLLKAGKKIGICEQVSTSADSKSKLFERKVIRVITPGTVMEDNMLEAHQSNFLVCLKIERNSWGLACVEVSTGQFWTTQNLEDPHFTALAGALASVNPAEIAADADTLKVLQNKIVLPAQLPLTEVPAFNGDFSLPEHWAVLEKWTGRELALSCALQVLAYVSSTEPGIKDTLIPVYRELGESLQIDENAVNSLELVKSQEGGRTGSLWALLDHTKTSFGSRKLKEWILHPSLSVEEIERRQDSVEGLMKNQEALGALASILQNISDVERIMTRVAAGNASPRDLGGLRQSLLNSEPLFRWLEKYGQTITPQIKERFDVIYPAAQELAKLLYEAIQEEPPLRIGDGNIIRAGYNAELDELRNLRTGSGKALEELCQREREKTGITNMKAGYNSVYGYYFEVTKSHIEKVPYNYTRRQTLTNAERFITEELKDLENKILNADSRILRLESGLFDAVRKVAAGQMGPMKEFAQTAAELDVYLSLALAAMKYHYVRPVVNEGTGLSYKNGRHPIVESLLPAGSFVPNHLDIDGLNTQLMLITGPNMGGKSVFLKQTALLVIMAQMGSFVPAQEAVVGIVDKIMTRIGAHDALQRGNSTFMVEMNETAHILSSQTSRSLILLDEVGRGTSTFDGISIAWSIVEYLYKPRGGAKVLFATHYFELVDLENKYPSIKNFHVEAKEYKDSMGQSKLAFLYQILPGAADQSYGIHVAEIAGLPAAVTIRARKVLKDLEAKKGTRISAKEKNPVQDLFSAPIVQEIKMTDPDKLTPMGALQLIAEWKKRVENE
ncbi:MAG: DNA mismatch repair protein MutS [Elusimicrobiaceae bacterium]|nr:DNA mismatch repair protein MutS [Elusimicrobiaceae bacterium]